MQQSTEHGGDAEVAEMVSKNWGITQSAGICNTLHGGGAEVAAVVGQEWGVTQGAAVCNKAQSMEVMLRWQ